MLNIIICFFSVYVLCNVDLSIMQSNHIFSIIISVNNLYALLSTYFLLCLFQITLKLGLRGGTKTIILPINCPYKEFETYFLSQNANDARTLNVMILI